jgi:manganese transport protein
VALMLALLVNASILILAAATFHTAGHVHVNDLTEAHGMLEPLVGSLLAPKLFAVALLCCGLSSTVTATLAGQIVMEGFPQHPAACLAAKALHPHGGHRAGGRLVTLYYGSEGTGMLLILSQVILAFQLPFAIVPLVMFTRDKVKMGTLVAPGWLTAVSMVIAAIVISLNVKLLWDVFLG